jgi:peptidoglycan/xylan/chitin deacetylase (PgdA/CDA1 family)
VTPSSAGESRRLLRWPSDRRTYLTLDLECDYGTALQSNRYGALERVDEFRSLVEHYDVPLTVFVQTEVLDARPEAVESLRDVNVPVEFHPHSHTHTPRSDVDVSGEVNRSTDRFYEFFGVKPTGYRFPDGDVLPEDYAVLAENGYEFDASLFPSWRPGRFNHLGEPTVPHRRVNHDIYEIPFTTFSDVLPLPTSLSYCRFIGRPSLALLSGRSEQPTVFNVHMHDLFNPESYRRLPLPYRAIYARNADGFSVFERALDALAGSGRSAGRFEDLMEYLRHS